MKIEEIVNDSEILYSSDEIKVGIANIADAINEYFGDMKDNVTVPVSYTHLTLPTSDLV